MKKGITTISPAFEDIMPEEYRQLVAEGPFGKDLGLGDLGTFKELIEEHPLCAGCGLALGIRLIIASLPAPENTIVVGTTGCSAILFPQLAMHNIHSLFGNQSAIATGLSRALRLRYPDQPKDVVVIAGDGGIGDIGFSFTMQAWFRNEKFTTIMLDNEGYSNTGGQESGMTRQGIALNMAPTGKKYPKLPMVELAKTAGCAYVAAVNPSLARRLGKMVRRAVLVAREIGSTYIQVMVPCPTNYKFSPSETLKQAKALNPQPIEYISAEAEQLLKEAEK
ncbi:thiamine pyrophosphate-dependent enzyme [Candidatus Acetothermia bacterium]|jgi:pyruvate ferredoxin oxidoreductase beta subunit|nr:thiamine pyrophosphate-dependent enzyme [Candidatus Acetothermia bacterium]MCI2426623.1 thiamine pyrophosphate-dependent enzyme [Candidatus Acetothermia bacterium]MCI2427904.1 thiamine pyrophosphate-dependent enzyme [Candidatus Acetothermia bacterium]MCI2428103.1 thiamine pyrophosphate-dependent enzyme [Candidatus Acetothermia bacterium]